MITFSVCLFLVLGMEDKGLWALERWVLCTYCSAPRPALMETSSEETDWNRARSSIHLWVSGKVAFYIFPFCSSWKCFRAVSSGEICALSQRIYNSYPFLFSLVSTHRQSYLCSLAFISLLPVHFRTAAGSYNILSLQPCSVSIVSQVFGCAQSSRKCTSSHGRCFFLYIQ